MGDFQSSLSQPFWSILSCPLALIILRQVFSKFTLFISELMQSNKSVHFEDDCNSCISDCTECLFNSVNDSLNRKEVDSGLYGQSFLDPSALTRIYPNKARDYERRNQRDRPIREQLRDQSDLREVRAYESERIVQARNRPPPPVPPPSRDNRSMIMDDRVPVSPQFYPEGNDYEFPPPPTQPEHNYHSPYHEHSQPTRHPMQQPIRNDYSPQLSPEPIYRRVPESNSSPETGRIEPIRDHHTPPRFLPTPTHSEPRSEVVVPPTHGVGTLATKFEKQARLGRTKLSPFRKKKHDI